MEKVLSSFDVVGGPHTFNVVWTTTNFANKNRKVLEAFVAALDDVMQQIARNPVGEGRAFQAVARLRYEADPAE